MIGGRGSIGGVGVATLVLAAAVAVAGCGSTTASPTAPGSGASASLVPPASGSPAGSSGDTAAPEPSGLASPVRGLVLHVDQAGLGKVTAFRLQTQDGQQIDFTMGVQENTLEFPAAHLSDHMAAALPVIVYFRRVGNQLVVYRLEDADATSASPASSPSPASPASS